MDNIVYSDYSGNGVTETSFTNQSGTRLDTDEYPTRCVVDYDADTFGRVTHTTGNNSTFLRIYCNTTTTSNGFYLKWRDVSEVDFIKLEYSTDGISWYTLTPDDIWGYATKNGSYIYPTSTPDGTGQCLVLKDGSFAWKYIRVRFYDSSGYPADTQLEISWFIPITRLNVHPPDASRSIGLESNGINTEQSFDGNLWTTVFGAKPRVLPEISWKDLDQTELTSFSIFKGHFKNNPHIILYTEESNNDDWYVCSWLGEDFTYTETSAGLYDTTLNLREL